VNGHIDELWPLCYCIEMIDKIPTFDDKKLSAIEENANRLIKVGNDKEQTLKASWRRLWRSVNDAKMMLPIG
jgi:hypothetical protein